MAQQGERTSIYLNYDIEVMLTRLCEYYGRNRSQLISHLIDQEHSNIMEKKQHEN